MQKRRLWKAGVDSAMVGEQVGWGKSLAKIWREKGEGSRGGEDLNTLRVVGHVIDTGAGM